MRLTFAFALLAAFAFLAPSQEFEVVSVKPNKSGSSHSGSHSDPGMLTANNLTLRSMIVQAYAVKDYQVDGPEWLRTEKFDVAGKYSGMPKDRKQYRAMMATMMRKMLEDRFKIAVHREPRTLAVYALVVEKKGIKFKEVPDAGSHSRSNDSHYEGTGVLMESFADFLSQMVNQPVLDTTGLKGAYEIKLDWKELPPSGDAAADDELGRTTIPSAIRDQLGLRLERRKAQVEMLVVDRIERRPTEN